MATLEQKLKSKTQVTATCHLWLGSQSDNGYGQLRHEGRPQGVHRLVYKLYHGEVPTGLDVMHTCDVRNCLNPAHLIAGTRQANMQDAATKGRLPHGRQSASGKLTEEQVLKIRKLLSLGLSNSSIARTYAVNPSAISRIKTKTDGAWLKEPS
jgi:hypothetical protein